MTVVGNARIRLELGEEKERDGENISRSVRPRRDEGLKCTYAQNLLHLGQISANIHALPVWLGGSRVEIVPKRR